MTEVSLITQKSDSPLIIMKYIKIIENQNSKDNYRVRILRCQRDKENYPKEVRCFGDNRGIEVKFSPANAPKSNGAAERLVQEH